MKDDTPPSEEYRVQRIGDSSLSSMDTWASGVRGSRWSGPQRRAQEYLILCMEVGPLSKCRFWFSRPGQELRFHITKKLRVRTVSQTPEARKEEDQWWGYWGRILLRTQDSVSQSILHTCPLLLRNIRRQPEINYVVYYMLFIIKKGRILLLNKNPSTIQFYTPLPLFSTWDHWTHSSHIHSETSDTYIFLLSTPFSQSQFHSLCLYILHFISWFHE